MGVPLANKMVPSAPTHPMHTHSCTSPVSAAAVNQNSLTARLNNILSQTFRCVLNNPKLTSPQKVSPRRNQLKIRTRSCKASPFGNPYKYSDNPTTDHYEAHPQPGPFNNFIGDGFFEDDEQGFLFEDLIPILEEDYNNYDLEAAFRHYKDNTDYRDKGDRADDPQVSPQPQPGDQPEEDQAPILRPASPADQLKRITMPR
jgi:hypothetical protein